MSTHSEPSLTIPPGWSVQGSHGEYVRGNRAGFGKKTGDDDKQNPTDYPSEDYGASN